MARVHLEHVREKIGSGFPPNSPWWAWSLRHAAWAYNRFHVRADTRSAPYSKIRIRTYVQLGLPFGGLVLARRPGAHLQKSQTQFVYGCWLGRDSQANTLLGARLGISARERSGDWKRTGVGRRKLSQTWNGRSGKPRQRRGQATKGCCWREERTHMETHMPQRHEKEALRWSASPKNGKVRGRRPADPLSPAATGRECS